MKGESGRKKKKWIAYKKREVLRRLEIKATTKLGAEEAVMKEEGIDTDTTIYDRERIEHLEETK